MLQVYYSNTGGLQVFHQCDTGYGVQVNVSRSACNVRGHPPDALAPLKLDGSGSKQAVTRTHNVLGASQARSNQTTRTLQQQQVNRMMLPNSSASDGRLQPSCAQNDLLICVQLFGKVSQGGTKNGTLVSPLGLLLRCSAITFDAGRAASWLGMCRRRLS